MSFRPLDIQVNMQALMPKAESVAHQANFTSQEAFKLDQSEGKKNAGKDHRVDQLDKNKGDVRSETEDRQALQAVSEKDPDRQEHRHPPEPKTPRPLRYSQKSPGGQVIIETINQPAGGQIDVIA